MNSKAILLSDIVAIYKTYETSCGQTSLNLGNTIFVVLYYIIYLFEFVFMNKRKKSLILGTCFMILNPLPVFFSILHISHPYTLLVYSV